MSYTSDEGNIETKMAAQQSTIDCRSAIFAMFLRAPAPP